MDFSVIVPTFNRPGELAACVQALEGLDYASDHYEIVVVDDGSDIAVESTLCAHNARARLRCARQSNQGPGAARNLGAQLAQGRWLAFTDDDCRPRAPWLRELRVALEQGSDVLAGGRTFNELRANAFSEASQWVVDAAYDYFNHDPRRARFLASNNMAVERAGFLATGGFDPSFRVASEDRELCDRWMWRGGRIVWRQQAEVEHRHALTLGSFLRQHYAYGRGAARYHHERSKRGSGRVWDDLAFRWRWRALLEPAIASAHPAAGLGLLACWQVANTLGFMREAAIDWTKNRRTR